MINNIFGTPVLVIPMPNHEIIKEQFLPFLEDENSFAKSEQWDCNCDTTMLDEERNGKFPWDIFFENVQAIAQQYSEQCGFIGNSLENLFGFAWVNRYVKDQHQEIHAHEGNGNLISCAYILEQPKDKDTGEFIFYNSASNWFPADMLEASPNVYGKRFNPMLNEGDIVFFPSKLDHYVTYNKTDLRRATISANFGVR